MLSGGSRRCKAASTATRSCSKKAFSVICWMEDMRDAPHESRLILFFRLEGFGNELAIGFLQQDFDFAFGLFELLLAFAG